MRLLLGTHVFLWYIAADPQLPVAFRDAIRDPNKAVARNNNSDITTTALNSHRAIRLIG